MPSGSIRLKNETSLDYDRLSLRQDKLLIYSRNEITRMAWSGSQTKGHHGGFMSSTKGGEIRTNFEQ